MAPHPRITVVTPSFNQARFLETTLRSVLDQNYPALEYRVVDGGSTDGSVDILRRYADRLDSWVSERDRGQAHAINKGFAGSTGDILCWLNSDDYFAPGALHRVAELMQDPSLMAVAGGHIRVHADGTPPMLLHAHPPRGKVWNRRNLLRYWHPYGIHQASVFWRRQVHESVGPLREDLHLVLDFEFWARMTRRYTLAVVPDVLSYSHYHPDAKTGRGYDEYHAHRVRLAKALWREEPLPERFALHRARLSHWLRIWTGRE